VWGDRTTRTRCSSEKRPHGAARASARRTVHTSAPARHEVRNCPWRGASPSCTVVRRRLAQDAPGACITHAAVDWERRARPCPRVQLRADSVYRGRHGKAPARRVTHSRVLQEHRRSGTAWTVYPTSGHAAPEHRPTPHASEEGDAAPPLCARTAKYLRVARPKSSPRAEVMPVLVMCCAHGHVEELHTERGIRGGAPPEA
jgi:hypothetical protein